MVRAGPEPKPPWRAIPAAIRHLSEEVLGARVARAERAWGGYAPSVTFRLRLADGRHAFFKGVNATSNAHMRRGLAIEERAYRTLGAVIGPWAPAFRGGFRHANWHVLLLEDLSPASIPPWTAATARRAAHGLAEFHRSTLGRPLPRWLPRRDHHRFARLWHDLAAEEGGLEGPAGLAGPRMDEALAWLRAALPILRDSAERLAHARPPHALLHGDVRSDNIRLMPAGLRLLDWPDVAVGPVEFDAVAFAQSVPCEGGPQPEPVLAWYAERLPPRQPVVDASVAAVAGYFAGRAWRPAPPELPRVRSIQRRQLRASLAWAARRLNLPEPTWLEAIQP